ncbi:MAG: isocitrate/isopropylmalate dehydrogenase family protein [Chloroflexi bacterium]|nr:isocitrate/isopropylmalate dehydrogenase family protein [Chloroflexota bacterium]
MPKRVVVIEGEDAAPEAVRPTVEILRLLGLDIEFLTPPTGQEAIDKYSTGFPNEARNAIDASDATLFGATSGKSAGAIVYLRWGKQLYANVRPVRWLPGFNSPLRDPEGIDFVIVRENLEDVYMGLEGPLRELALANPASRITGEPLDTDREGRFTVKVITEEGSRRIASFACRLALQRKASGYPGKLTVSAKTNMLAADRLFCRVAEDVCRGEFPHLIYEQFIVDDFARRIVADPQALDVVLLPNLYGDILSDEAAGIIGGLGLCPSACYGDSYAYFEPVHGSAPDIAGRNVINPTATLLSAAMMLDYLGFAGAARRLEDAVAAVYAEGRALTPDQGGIATTTEFCEAVKERL